MFYQEDDGGGIFMSSVDDQIKRAINQVRYNLNLDIQYITATTVHHSGHVNPKRRAK